MTTPLLLADLRRDEGFRPMPYPDPLSGGDPWTDGYGNTHGVVPGQPVTLEHAEAQLEANVAGVEAALDAAIPWWRGLDDVRQDALANAAFNMGVGRPPSQLHPGCGLLNFQITLGDLHAGESTAIAALKAGDFEKAASDILASRWANQVGARAQRIAYMLRTGTRP